MELRHLRYFVVVAETGTIGAAARQLRVAQPALSRQMRQLEDEVGTPLLERLPRGVRLTAAGTVFLAEGRATIDAAARAAARARRAARGEVGTLRVGFVEPSMYSGIVARAVRDYRRAHTDVAIELHLTSSPALLRAVRRGRLDVGFACDVEEFAGPGLALDRAGTDSFLLALPRGHALVRRPRLRLRDLVDEPFLWFDRAHNPGCYDRVERACSAGGLHLRVVQRCRNHATALSLVAAGVGCTFILASARQFKPADVVLRPVRDLRLSLTVSTVTRSDDTAPTTRDFLRVARAIARGT